METSTRPGVPIPNLIAVFSLLRYFGLEIGMKKGKKHFSFKCNIYSIYIKTRPIQIY